MTRALRGRALAIVVLLLVASLVGLPPADAAFDPDVEAVQTRLSALGYEPGPADGLIGPRTRSAIAAFRDDRGLPPGGRIDTVLLGALGLIESPEPSPPEPEPLPDADDLPEAEPDPAPQPVRAEARPGLLTYDRLGWKGPESGRSALARFRASGDSPVRGRISGELIVPSGAHVYVLDREEHVTGLNCDPAGSRLSVEPMFDLDGPLSFVSRGERGMCQLGFGVVLLVGSTLYMEAFTWGEISWPAGEVRLGAEGLEYLTD